MTHPFYTSTFTLTRAGATIASNVPCSPIVPYTKERAAVLVIEYGNDKPFTRYETFTANTQATPGDEVVSGGITYQVGAVHPWPALGGIEAATNLILEKTA